MISYPTTPDLTIAAGDYVRSFDFPGITDCYIEGNVVEVRDGHYKIRASFRVLRDKVRVSHEFFFVPVNGAEGFFGPTRGVEKVRVV